MNRRPILPAILAAAVTFGCASLMGDSAWADGEVRDLETRRPIPGAHVSIELPGGPVERPAFDRSNDAGRFAVFRSPAGGERTILLVVVADGFQRAEYPLPTGRSNLLIAYMAPAGSLLASRIEQMPAPAEGCDGSSDASSGN